ncbi:UNVERIFIED_CONTAM: hypothetical protein Slati_0403200 [Sesamum latifolium]|uniref:Uncharacterized protein n=1 Tax=Sesamum latifolium TaxID=2727402 RepID=A0AAW2XVW3_9LAMI
MSNDIQKQYDRLKDVSSIMLRMRDICMHYQEKGYWMRECPQLLSNQGMFVVEVLQRSRRSTKDEMILRLVDGKAVAAKVVGSVELAISHQ